MVWAAACLVLGLLFAVAWLLAPEEGFLRSVHSFERYLLGKGVFLLPVALFAASWKLLVDGQLRVFNKLTWKFVLVTLCLLGTAHHVFVPFGSELEPSLLPDGGGLIGGLGVLLLHRTVGGYATTAILASCWLLLMVLLLPLRSLWERLQDYLTADELTLVRPTAAKRAERKNSAIAAAGVFKRSEQKAAEPKRSEAAAAAGSVMDSYGNKDFEAFTEGLQKQGPLKRMLSFNDKGAYSEPLVKENLERDPVQLPDWEQRRPEVILRPIIDYDNDGGYVPDSRFLDDEPVQTEAHEVQQTASVINNTYETVQTEAFEQQKPQQVTEKEAEPFEAEAFGQQEEQSQVTIFDSADKIQTAAVEKPRQEVQPGAQESTYRLPPIEILDMPRVSDPASYQKDIMDQCAVLEQTLADFKVRAKVIAVTRGPSVTRFELEPAPGVKVSSVVNLADDIALRLAAPGVRIEAPIPGKSAIGIEAPNTKNDTVCFREVVEDAGVRSAGERLCIGLGKDISGNIISADLAKMPHLLVAGSTGSGKSVCINTIIAGLLYRATPDEVKLILVDPKVVELSNYNGIPHLLTPVVTEPKKAASALHWAVAEMERRYKAFADSHVRDIKGYNAQATDKMSYIVIIIDELSDLMMVAKVDVEDAILRLAQKARAAGIHLILATQRPSVDVITGIVKANIPSRIAFAVSSQTDSRTIIDMGGAEKLLGKGDMLFYPIGYNKPVRVQGAFVSDAELNKIVEFIVKQAVPVNYSEEVTAQELECDSKNNNAEEAGSNAPAEDELFEDALNLVLDMGQASSSMLQRRFRIGYTRAARLVDTMEELGIVGQSVGSKPREVIISRKEAEERFLRRE